MRARAILAVGWITLVLYAYPGLMTMDSFDQLREGRAWFFTDAHPPAMAALWGVLDRIYPGPLPMLLLQSGAFLFGLFLILRRMFTPTRAAIAAVVIFLFPPVFVPLAVIWKDCLMAGFLLLGLAALLSGDRRWKLAGLALLSLATAMRYNAPAATFAPILLWFSWRPMHWLARYAIALAAWLLVTASAMGCNAALTHREMHFWHSSLALEDIVGTLAHVDDLPDSELGPILAPTGILVDRDYHAKIRKQYAPYDFQQLITGEGHLWNVPISGIDPAPAPQREAIERAWKAIVPTHPGAYLAYREEVMEDVLGVHERYRGAIVIKPPYQYKALLDAMHVEIHSNWFSRKLQNLWLDVSRTTRLFRPHVWVLLALGLLLVGIRERDIAGILLSGLGLEASLIPLVQSPDFRYTHWLIACTVLAFVMQFARRLNARDIGGGA